MSRKVTPELFAAFMNEAQEHLAEIGPVVSNLDESDRDALKHAFRHSHNLKGSASLLGLSTLSHVARVQEEILEALFEEERQLTDEIKQLLDATFRATVMCIHSPGGIPSDEAAILASVFVPFRRMNQLPIDGDGAAIRELLPVATTASVEVPAPSNTKTKSKRASNKRTQASRAVSVPGPIAEKTASTSDSSSPGADASWLTKNDASAEIIGWLNDMANVDAEYASIYAEESEESLLNLRRQLDLLKTEPNNIDNVQAVRRLMHNLKGASATVGFTAVSKLAHQAENILDRTTDGEAMFSVELIPLLNSVVDTMEDLAARSFETDVMAIRLSEILNRLDSHNAATIPHPACQGGSQASALPEAGKTINATDAATSSAEAREPLGQAQWSDGQSVTAEESTETRILNVLESLTPAFIDIDAALPPSIGTMIPSINDLAQRATAAASPTGETVRVPIEKLDALVRLVTELVVNRTSFEQRMQGLNSAKEELRFSLKRIQELASKFSIDLDTKTNAGEIAMPWDLAGCDMPKTEVVQKPDDHRGKLGGVEDNGRDHNEFDALELDRYTELHILARSLTEAASDIHTVQNELGNVSADFDQLLNRQSVISRDLQDRLMQARLIPLGTLEARLARTVRQAAEQVGKSVKLHLEGNSVPIDKTMLDELVDPLTHLLRNAVDHGIEAADVRTARNKSAEASIRIRAFHQGTQVVLQVSDDGAGLNLEALRAKAIHDGHVSASNAESLTKAELQNLIFVHGLSTASSVSELSGRGVGMDAVRTAVNKLKGTITVDSTAEVGTTFSIRLPMTLAITEALFVEAAHEKFAIPLQDVLQIIRLDRKELDRVGNSPVLRMGGVVYPLVYLRDALHLAGSVDDTQLSVPVLFVNVGDKQVAFAVDRIIASREIVVKTLGTHFRHVHGLIGATLLGDGTVVPILNCSEVLEAPVTRTVSNADESDDVAHDARITVMIVDDSVSVRRITAKILNAAGMETILCRDGVDALETLQRLPNAPDLVLLDVEMPRMDGYELLSTLRSQSDYETLPVVMVTSRSGDKHRNKAESLGATDYLVKPYDEDELITTIQHHVANARELVGA